MAESMPYADCYSVPDWNNPGFLGDFTNECYANEKAIMDNLIAENANINGITCVYYRMSLDTKKDEFFGDDPTKHAIDTFRFMAMLPESPSLKFFSFSIVLDDIIDIEAGIAHFKASQTNHKMQPMVGDVVQTLYNKMFWQVIYVDDMAPKTQPQSVKTVYKIKLRQWENNHHGTEFPNAEGSDNPMGDMKDYQDLVDKDALFKADADIEKLKQEDKTFYKPDDVELPPNNDKDNPFPRFW